MAFEKLAIGQLLSLQRSTWLDQCLTNQVLEMNYRIYYNDDINDFLDVRLLIGKLVFALEENFV